MKLLQLNVWGGRLENQIINLLEQEDPDVVCFQEAISYEGKHGGFFGPIQELVKKTDLKNYHFSPVFGIGMMRREADFGNCIMTKHSILSKETIFTRNEYNANFDFSEDDYNIRNLQHVSIRIDNQRFHILNHHGHHIHQHKNGDAETIRQCKEIVDYIKQLEGKVILTGDFNLAPESESLSLINQVLNNLCIENNVKTTRTPLTRKTEVCDYIFTSRDIKPISFKVLEDLASDHSALTVEL